MFDKHIKINHILDVSVLSTRATARRLFIEEIKNSDLNKFELDFKGIEFASRSFMDEMNSLLKSYPYTFEKVNMNDQVQQMDKLVLEADENPFFIESRDSSHPNLVTI